MNHLKFPFLTAILFTTAAIAAQPTPVLVRSNYTVDEINAACARASSDANAQLQQLLALPASKRTFQNTVLRLETIIADIREKMAVIEILSAVAIDEKIRAAAAKCDSEPFSQKAFANRALFDALHHQKPSNASERRLYETTLMKFKKNGVDLPLATRERIGKLQEEISTLERQYSLNINNDRSVVELTDDEMFGVPADYKNSLKKTPNGLYIVPAASWNDMNAYIGSSKSFEGRRKFFTVYDDRAGEANTEILKKLIVLRAETAKLLGFRSWADFAISGQMADDPIIGGGQNALNFLNGLRQKLEPLASARREKLLAQKRKIIPTATEIYRWEESGFQAQIAQTSAVPSVPFDSKKAKEYFPVDRVIQGMFEIYSGLFGLSFHEVPNAEVWAPDVKLYGVRDLATDRTIAYFYADWFPRDGKITWPGNAFSVVRGRRLRDGQYNLPVSVIVANLTKPLPSQPAFASNWDITVVFHEFGHVMHDLLTKAPYASLAGTSVARDFSEAPSQMFENWIKNPEILQKISGHYLNPEEKIPLELARQMAERSNSKTPGLDFIDGMVYDITDLKIRMANDPVDPNQLWMETTAVTDHIDWIAGTRPAAAYDLFVPGSDAGLYRYSWALVFSDDMFTRFKREGLLNPKTGAEFRKKVLEKGAMKDAKTLLKDFLGRETNSDAFLRKIGL